jgi:hypothetical protein
MARQQSAMSTAMTAGRDAHGILDSAQNLQLQLQHSGSAQPPALASSPQS